MGQLDLGLEQQGDLYREDQQRRLNKATMSKLMTAKECHEELKKKLEARSTEMRKVFRFLDEDGNSMLGHKEFRMMLSFS